MVTGSTRGLGRVIALELARLGAAVAVHGRVSLAAGQAVVDEIRQAGGVAAYHPFDVADCGAVERGVEAIEQSLGPIGVLVTCASLFDTESLDDLSPEQWHAVLDATLSGTFHLCHTVIPRMRARRTGRVVTFGCTGCEHAHAGKKSVAYRIAVSGVLSLTRAWAQLAFADQVRINMIAPGHLENTIGAINPAMLPAGRLSRLEEILPTVRFLLSNASDHLSGACINVSGGVCA